MKRLAAFALAASCSGSVLGAETAATREPVSVLEPVLYSSEAAAPDWIRQGCHIEQQVVDDLHEALAAKGMGGAVVQSVGDGLVLRLTIERVIGQRGGGWSGPKTLTLGVTLLRAGSVERTTSQSIATKSLNPLAPTCASFERASSKLSDLIVKWLQVPNQTAGSAVRLAPAASAASDD